MSVHISDADVKVYTNDEWFWLKNLLASDEVVDLRAGIDENISNPSSRSKVASDEKDPG